jgi:hypothetical protein
MPFIHKRNRKIYLLKNDLTIKIKQTSSNTWENAVVYYDPMKPNDLYVSGESRFNERFIFVKNEYNGDELFDDIYTSVSETIKRVGQNEITSTDIVQAVLERIQPKIEALNTKRRSEL